jgi:DNA-binding NtrC family response regulator
MATRSLTVSDVRMPGMSGFDLVHELDVRRSIAPVSLITGLGDIDMAVSVIKGGAFDFIEKPFALNSVEGGAAFGNSGRTTQISVDLASPNPQGSQNLKHKGAANHCGDRARSQQFLHVITGTPRLRHSRGRE